MRKLLLFLLLFGAGLVSLYWLDRLRAPGGQEQTLPVVPDAAPAAVEQGITLGGKSAATIYSEETGRRQMLVESQGSRTEGGVDTLTGVHVELYDPEDEDVVQCVLEADSALWKRLDAGQDLHPSWEQRVQLQGVQVRILAGIPLAPFSFRSEEAVVDLRDPAARKVETEAAFSARSAELVITGRGLFCELGRALIEVAHEGRVELRHAGAEPSVFAATGDGPVQVRREGGPDSPVALEAWSGARLDLAGENPGHMSSEHVLVRALPAAPTPPGGAGAAGSRLVVEQVDADGDVDWSSERSRFQARSATVGFTPTGRLERARLVGLPRAQLALDLAPDVLVDPALAHAPGAPSGEVLIAGEDRIDITWRDAAYVVDMGGRSSVETRDLRLRSATGITGTLSEDQRSMRFVAGGGVEVESGLARLETAAFALEIETDEAGQSVLRGQASGGARLSGNLPAEPGKPERAFTLSSPEGLELERTAAGWRVIESTNVEVTLEDPEGFTASADRVEDFDLTRFGFQAHGNVHFDFAGLRFGGDQLVVTPGERDGSLQAQPRFTLSGPRERKAFFVGDYGRASALEVVVEEADTLHALGEVEVAIDLASTEKSRAQSYDLQCEEVYLRRVDSPELLPGERLRLVNMRALGGVRGNVVYGAETLLYRADRVTVDYRVRLVEGAQDALELGSGLVAEGAVRAEGVVRGIELSAMECDRLELERDPQVGSQGLPPLRASGNVRFQGRSSFPFGGEGDVLVLDAVEGRRHGSLQALPDDRVALYGRLSDQPFRMAALRVELELDERGQDRVRALRPELRIAGLHARAEHLLADDLGVDLTGGVRSYFATGNNVPMLLESQRVSLLWRPGMDPLDSEAAPVALETLAANRNVDLVASGGVALKLGLGLDVQAERMLFKHSNGLLRFEGSPVSFVTGSAVLESPWVEFDHRLQVLVGSGPGHLRSIATPAVAPQEGGSWTLDFLSSSTLLELDSLVFMLQEPVFHSQAFDSTLRASWGVLWTDRNALRQGPGGQPQDQFTGLREVIEHLRAGPASKSPTAWLDIFRQESLSSVLREIYLEGPVEVLTGPELVARSDAIYLDVASQHGWLAGATVNLAGGLIGRDEQNLIVKADWLRLSSDASLRADRATVTSCNYDDPHVRVVTGDLRIDPLANQDQGAYRLLLKNNRVELYDWLKVPLPTIDINTDKDLKPLLPSLSIANSARFGALLGIAITRPADAVGRAFDSAVRGEGEEGEGPAKPEAKPRSPVNAHYKVDGSYLGSRGGLLDLGLEIEAKKDYWFDLYTGLVFDNGEDRGFIRVPEEDRDTLRYWLRSQSFFADGDNATTFSFTEQSDPAVQSEFFESKFLRYERAENYVQWRRSSGENFVQATAKVRLDGDRTDIDELPSVSGYRGRSPLLRLGGLDLVHTGDLRAEYLRRREGRDPRSPFALPTQFADGLGDREVLRVDTTQSLEVPVPLGAGWKLTPFVSVRGTAWNEGQDPADAPTRVIAEGGARLGTTLWRRDSAGRLHRLAPYLEYSGELDRSDQGGSPVPFDSVEAALSGDFLKLGSRFQVGRADGSAWLDLDLAGTYGTNRSDGKPDGWLPLEAFGRVELSPFGQPFELFHDGRYDIENSQTDYSVLALGTRIGEDLGVQASHQRGRDVLGDALFETASIASLYRWTEKWEFQLRESFSLLENQRLDTHFGLRRYGHDLVLDIDVTFREGEGSSFGLSFRPRLGSHSPNVGYVPW